MDLAGFLQAIQNVRAQGDATEHSYRPALKALFDSIDPAVSSQNEPERLTKVGAPDFSFRRGDIVIGHAEAKVPGADLKNLKGREKDQLERYTKALPNLIYTDGLHFLFYRDGKLVHEVRIAAFDDALSVDADQFDALEHALKDFAAQTPQTITSPEDLARLMAAKAILIKDILGRSLVEDKDQETELADQYHAFKHHMIHDISIDDFAGMYAETVAYGMFAARLHDDSLDTFSREEALELLPKSNPFLRNLFSYIAGPNLDERIRWIIDDLAAVFRACNLPSIMEKFGELTGRDDPFLHFYETFLSAFDPDKRKARGVWYTPEPVVNFIVRAVDEVLQNEFGLPLGLADTSKVTIDLDTGQRKQTKKGTFTKDGKNQTERKDVHRVQILDPATGTGTFLAEVIKQIAPRIKDMAPGQWNKYVEDDLIPRLHGFELLMASYAMCHMKLDMILTEMGYKPTAAHPRLSVYLTNSLEEGDPADQTLPFAQWLSNEVKQANTIKRDMPIMCVIGNPPYNIMSSNLTPDQIALVDPYRFVDGIKIKEKGMLQFEKNINNDYIKFISLGEGILIKNGYGILSYITSHGYLKSASFRGLRQHLAQTFEKIFILDLHGNSEVREVPPAGTRDENVFDIRQGVCIFIGVRSHAHNRTTADVKYADFWGSRSEKNEQLENSSITSIDWQECTPISPNYTFHPSAALGRDYEQAYPSIAEWMPIYSSGVITARDGFSISEDPNHLLQRARAFAESPELSDSELCKSLGIRQKKGWDVSKARARLADKQEGYEHLIERISYRPFDSRFIIFDESVVWTTARSTMDHMLRGPNLALVSARSEKSGTCSHFYVSRSIVETKCAERTTQSALFPLFLYPSDKQLNLSPERRVNFDPELHKKMIALATHPEHGEPSPEDIFDYIYAVLHCPAYRETYAEFLKIDFPRIPWPKTPGDFWNLVPQGNELRRLHLMEPAAIGPAPYPFEGDGDCVVDKVRFEGGKVWINKTQAFAAVPSIAWNFYIGGYQPAQKWLKDRKGRALSFDDILHYQRIIKILSETDRIMQTIKLDIP